MGKQIIIHIPIRYRSFHQGTEMKATYLKGMTDYPALALPCIHYPVAQGFYPTVCRIFDGCVADEGRNEIICIRLL
jgi:hypothetical protein